MGYQHLKVFSPPDMCAQFCEAATNSPEGSLNLHLVNFWLTANIETFLNKSVKLNESNK
jgi:hypothetical protein